MKLNRKGVHVRPSSLRLFISFLHSTTIWRPILYTRELVFLCIAMGVSTVWSGFRQSILARRVRRTFSTQLYFTTFHYILAPTNTITSHLWRPCDAVPFLFFFSSFPPIFFRFYSSCATALLSASCVPPSIQHWIGLETSSFLSLCLRSLLGFHKYILERKRMSPLVVFIVSHFIFYTPFSFFSSSFFLPLIPRLLLLPFLIHVSFSSLLCQDPTTYKKYKGELEGDDKKKMDEGDESKETK